MEHYFRWVQSTRASAYFYENALFQEVLIISNEEVIVQNQFIFSLMRQEKNITHIMLNFYYTLCVFKWFNFI